MSFRGSRGNISLSKPLLGRRRKDAFTVSNRGQMHLGSESGKAFNGKALGSYMSFSQKAGGGLGRGGTISFGSFTNGFKAKG